MSVQVKGRDIFGMMKILPGVVDTTTSRDFAQWNSGRGLSINGGNSLNKNTTIDGVPVGEEGGDGTTYITPNIDAIGEVNVITSGYNGRERPAVERPDQHHHQVGHQPVPRVRLVQRPPRRVEQERLLPQEAGDAKPFFEVNIRGYSIGGPIIIPKLIDSRTSEKKFYFFVSQEFTDDVRPTDVSRTNLPTALERAGDFSQTFFGKATRATARQRAPVQPIIDPRTGQPFPGNVIPQNRINPMGQAMLNLLPLPNNVRQPAADSSSTRTTRRT